MGEDRLDALGIPRRGFLRKTAATAFVAPLVVSFGLDGVAEASPTSSVGNQPQPIQCFGNQPAQSLANQFDQNDEVLLNLLREILAALSTATAFGNPKSGISVELATALSGTLLLAMLEGATGSNAICGTLAAFQNEVTAAASQMPSSLAAALTNGAQSMADTLGCVCT